MNICILQSEWCVYGWCGCVRMAQFKQWGNKKVKTNRIEQDSNLWGRMPTDFKSVPLTTPAPTHNLLRVLHIPNHTLFFTHTYFYCPILYNTSLLLLCYNTHTPNDALYFYLCQPAAIFFVIIAPLDIFYWILVWMQSECSSVREVHGKYTSTLCVWLIITARDSVCATDIFEIRN